MKLFLYSQFDQLNSFIYSFNKLSPQDVPGTVLETNIIKNTVPTRKALKLVRETGTQTETQKTVRETGTQTETQKTMWHIK